jgi:uncharacterized membrane protein YgcG
MLVSLSDARFLRHNEMRLDLNNSDPLQTAYEFPEPENTNGLVIFAPALRAAWMSGKQYWVIVVGNCPTKRGGMGANMSKLFLAMKAAGKSVHFAASVAGAKSVAASLGGKSRASSMGGRSQMSAGGRSSASAGACWRCRVTPATSFRPASPATARA